MCLSRVNKSLKKFVKGLEIREDGYVWLWKVFNLDEDENLIPQFQNYSFYEGKNTAKGKIARDMWGYESKRPYKPGFHCFTNEKDAKSWCGEGSLSSMVVPIKVKKSWITSYGRQASLTVVVCKHIII